MLCIRKEVPKLSTLETWLVRKYLLIMLFIRKEVPKLSTLKTPCFLNANAAKVHIYIDHTFEILILKILQIIYSTWPEMKKNKPQPRWERKVWIREDAFHLSINIFKIRVTDRSMEVKLPGLLGNYDMQTDQPTRRRTKWAQIIRKQ